MATAILIKSTVLFASSMIIASISVVFYGDLYANVEHKHTAIFLKSISYFGIIISGTSLLISAYIMDKLDNGGAIVLCISGFALLFSIVYAYNSFRCR